MERCRNLLSLHEAANPSSPNYTSTWHDTKVQALGIKLEAIMESVCDVMN